MWHFDVLESTNETAKELLETDLEEGLVLWTDRQSAGKGRQGRTWASPAGGLHASVILRSNEPQACVPGLLAGMPDGNAFGHFGPFTGLKHPNDAAYQ